MGFDDIRENIRNRRMPMASTRKTRWNEWNRLPAKLIPTSGELKLMVSMGTYPRQITREQAIEIGESKIWEKWTDDEIVRFQLFQDKLAIPIGRFHEAVDRVLGRPVFTHEFSSENIVHLQKEYLKIESARSPGEILGSFRIGRE